MKKYLFYFFTIVATIAISCSDVRIEEEKQWGKFFEKHGVDGGFEIFENNKEIAHYYNLDLISTPKIPGSTFNIIASIVGIETSTILDENKSIYWVTKMENPNINKESNLREFYKRNDSIFFNQLPKEIGNVRLKDYLDSTKYGNKIVNEHLFWQNGDLLITPDEQVGLMKKIYFNKMSNISTRSTTIMQSMMIQENMDSIKLFYQITPVKENEQTCFWIVGFAETYNPLINPETEKIDKIIHPHFFAGYIMPKTNNVDSTIAIDIMNNILKDYGIPRP